MRQSIFALLLIASTATMDAHAQTPTPAKSRINAFACETLPDPLQIDVQVLDDSKQNLTYAGQFANALQARGITVARTAPTTAILEVKTVREFQAAPKGTLFDKRSDPASTGISGESDISVPGNIWSNRASSIFGGPKGPSDKLAVNQLRLSVTLNRRADGHCLWQGEALHELHGDDNPDAVAEKLIPALVRSLGQTVRNKTLTVFP